MSRIVSLGRALLQLDGLEKVHTRFLKYVFWSGATRFICPNTVEIILKANLSRTEWLLLRESGLASALSRNSLNRFERIKKSNFMFLKI